MKLQLMGELIQLDDTNDVKLRDHLQHNWRLRKQGGLWFVTDFRDNPFATSESRAVAIWHAIQGVRPCPCHGA